MRTFIRNLFSGQSASQKPNTTSRRLTLESLEDRTVPAVVDLTTVGAHATIGSVLFQQTDTQPTGSGVIHSFVRVHAGGIAAVAQGYNTDARPLQYDENSSPVFTRSLQLSEAPIVFVNGVAYREFLLDINQKASSPLLSLDEMRIYVGGAPNLKGYDPVTKQLAGLTAVYDLDAGTDNAVMLNARLSHGSGSGDVQVLVPDALLTEPGGNYVYLYSKFGATTSSNGGFEEWAVRAQGVALSSISGFAYTDQNSNGVFDSGDTGLNNVLITLTGVNDLGQSITWSQWTGQNASGVAGFYDFSGLRPGTYTITETLPPDSQPGTATVGSLGGTAGYDQFGDLVFSLSIQAGTIGHDYDFGSTMIPITPIT